MDHNYEHLSEPQWWIKRIIAAVMIVVLGYLLTNISRDKSMQSPAPVTIQQPDIPLRIEFVYKDDSPAKTDITAKAIGFESQAGIPVQLKWDASGVSQSATIEVDDQPLKIRSEAIELSVLSQHWTGVNVPVVLSWKNPGIRAVEID